MITEGTRPNPVKAASAAAWLMPTRFGTVTPAIVVVVVALVVVVVDDVVVVDAVVVVVDEGIVVVGREVDVGATPYWLTK